MRRALFLSPRSAISSSSSFLSYFIVSKSTISLFCLGSSFESLDLRDIFETFKMLSEITQNKQFIFNLKKRVCSIKMIRKVLQLTFLRSSQLTLKVKRIYLIFFLFNTESYFFYLKNIYNVINSFKQKKISINRKKSQKVDNECVDNISEIYKKKNGLIRSPEIVDMMNFFYWIFFLG